MMSALSAVINFGQLFAKKTIANAFAVAQRYRLDTLKPQALIAWGPEQRRKTAPFY